MLDQPNTRNDLVVFEASIASATGRSIFLSDVPTDASNYMDFAPPPGRAEQAAARLQALGFRVVQIGKFSISAEGSRDLWERVFNTRVEQREQLLNPIHPEHGQVSFFSSIAGAPFIVPDDLSEFVERAYPQPPAILYESPTPPSVSYYHLRAPEDIAKICRSAPVHQLGVTGKGVKVAMVDSGFYKHPYYETHGYNYSAILAKDAFNLERDEVGHGTAEAANIFANAPDVSFFGVKAGLNFTLAFKTAVSLQPDIITNSWGFDLTGSGTLPNYLKPLELAIIEAVQNLGITVCFAAGNVTHDRRSGVSSFPAMMPQVIAVGGVYAHDAREGDDFLLEASNYASSFDSQIYLGRHVPDISGLVGLKPQGIYIMLPVDPNSQIDQGLGGDSFPDKDETGTNDGWAVLSGTSAATPQIAGICALLKQVRPDLSPSEIKRILQTSARDVSQGVSATGQPAGQGADSATGAGLVDAHAAYQQIQKVPPQPPDNQKELIAKAIQNLLQELQQLRAILAATDRDELELKRLDSLWDDILMQQDVPAIKQLLSDDYISINPYGGINNKEEEIAAMTRGDFLYESIQTSEVNVRVYGNTGVVLGRLRMKGRFRGEPVTGDYRYSDVYVKREQGWQVVAYQATPILPPQPHL